MNRINCCQVLCIWKNNRLLALSLINIWTCFYKLFIVIFGLISAKSSLLFLILFLPNHHCNILSYFWQIIFETFDLISAKLSWWHLVLFLPNHLCDIWSYFCQIIFVTFGLISANSSLWYLICTKLSASSYQQKQYLHSNVFGRSLFSFDYKFLKIDDITRS